MIQRSNLCCGIKMVMKLSHVGFHQSYRSLNKLQVMRRIMNIGAHTLSDTACKCDQHDEAGGNTPIPRVVIEIDAINTNYLITKFI